MASPHHPPEPSRRQLRVVQEIRAALAKILNEDILTFDLPARSITVTHVDISPDLRNCNVYVTSLGQDSAHADALARALRDHTPHIRHQMAKLVVLRYLPHLHFHADRSFDHAMSLRSALTSERVRRDVENTTANTDDNGDHR